MTNRFPTKLQAVLLIVIIVFSSTGVYALLQSMEPKKAYAQVWGDVVLDQPLVGAAISVFDQNGELLIR
jgi:hypothetical protein